MTRTKWIFGIASLLSIAAWTTVAFTQQTPDFNPSRKNPQRQPNVPRPGGESPFDSSPVPNPSYDPNEYLMRNYPPGPGPAGSGIRARTRAITRQFREYIAVPMTPEEIKQAEEFQKAKQNLKVAKDEDARKAAMDVIQKQLVKSFEQDLTQRETDLAAIEERVKLLRKQLDKRKAARDEIISLRLKTIVNNAEGLGFPGDDEGSDASFDTPTYYSPGIGVPTPVDSDDDELPQRKNSPLDAPNRN